MLENPSSRTTPSYVAFTETGGPPDSPPSRWQRNLRESVVHVNLDRALCDHVVHGDVQRGVARSGDRFPAGPASVPSAVVRR